MLIIGLIAAAILYGTLYWLYLAAESQMAGATSTLAVIDRMLALPEPNVFFIFRWLLVITAIYVLTDIVLHPARRGLRNRRKRRRDAEHDRTAFRGAKPVAPPVSPDDTLPHF